MFGIGPVIMPATIRPVMGPATIPVWPCPNACPFRGGPKSWQSTEEQRDSLESACPRNRRRQVNNTLGLTALRHATTETVSPYAGRLRLSAK